MNIKEYEKELIKNRPSVEKHIKEIAFTEGVSFAKQCVKHWIEDHLEFAVTPQDHPDHKENERVEMAEAAFLEACINKL